MENRKTFYTSDSVQSAAVTSETSDIGIVQQAWGSNADEQSGHSLPTTPARRHPKDHFTKSSHEVDILPKPSSTGIEHAQVTRELSSSPNWIAYGSSSPPPSSPPEYHGVIASSDHVQAPQSSSTQHSDDQSFVHRTNGPTIFLRPSLSYKHNSGLNSFDDNSDSDSQSGHVETTEEFHESAFLSDTDELDEKIDDESIGAEYQELEGYRPHGIDGDDNGSYTADLGIRGPSDDSIEFEAYKRDLELMRIAARTTRRTPLSYESADRAMQTSPKQPLHDVPFHGVLVNHGSVLKDRHANRGYQNSALHESRCPTKKLKPKKDTRSMPGLDWFILLTVYALGTLMLGLIVWELIAGLFNVIFGFAVKIIEVLWNYDYKLVIIAAYRCSKKGFVILDKAIENLFGVIDN
ncbi:hypothetical protein ABW21_db0205216 [Orbilia brochopaga]|nr:hypothetical protein ABW21_db0205216 [Drechslerella brochopaga]